MFSGFPNSDDVGFIEGNETVGTNVYHIPSNTKSHYFVLSPLSLYVYLPSISEIGKTVTLHRPLGVTGSGRTSASSSCLIWSGNTQMFNLYNGSVTFVYTGSYLNAFSAGVTTGRDSKSGWVVVGNAMSVNPQLGNASSVVIGSGAYSSASSAVVLGVGANTAGARSIVLGASCSSSQSDSVVIGSSSTASTADSVVIGNSSSGAGRVVAIGYISNSSVAGDISFGQQSGGKGLGTKLSLRPCNSTGVSALSDNQSGMYMPHRLSIDATPVNMTTSNAVNSTANLIGAENNSTHSCIGTVTAREGATGDSAMWEVKLLMRRGANASTTEIVGTPTINKLFNTTNASAWTLSASADTTNGGVYFIATGETAKTIKWSSNIQYSMVTG